MATDEERQQHINTTLDLLIIATRQSIMMDQMILAFCGLAVLMGTMSFFTALFTNGWRYWLNLVNGSVLLGQAMLQIRDSLRSLRRERAQLTTLEVKRLAFGSGKAR